MNVTLRRVMGIFQQVGLAFDQGGLGVLFQRGKEIAAQALSASINYIARKDDIRDVLGYLRKLSDSRAVQTGISITGNQKLTALKDFLGSLSTGQMDNLQRGWGSLDTKERTAMLRIVTGAKGESTLSDLLTLANAKSSSRTELSIFLGGLNETQREIIQTQFKFRPQQIDDAAKFIGSITDDQASKISKLVAKMESNEKTRRIVDEAAGLIRDDKKADAIGLIERNKNIFPKCEMIDAIRSLKSEQREQFQSMTGVSLDPGAGKGAWLYRVLACSI